MLLCITMYYYLLLFGCYYVLLQRIFSEVLVLMLLYSIMDHLYECFCYLRGLFQWVQDSACNLTFKLSFTVIFFWMVHHKKLFRRSGVNYWTFSEGPTWIDLFPYVVRKKMKNRHKLSKYYSILGKNREMFGPYNSWTLVKSNISLKLLDLGNTSAN